MDIDDFSDNPRYKSVLGRMQVHADMNKAPARRMLNDTPLAQGEISAIYGKPGSRKSLLAIDLACRLAAGMDRYGGGADGRYTVLYIARERADQVRRRVDAFCLHHGIGRLEDLVIYDGEIDLAELSDDLLMLLAAASDRTYTRARRLRELGIDDDADGNEVAVVFIDTIAAAMTKPTSNTEATHNAAQNMTRAVRESGAHLCFIHHPPLSGENRMTGGHFTGAADITISVEKRGQLSTARIQKNNAASDEVASVTYGSIGVDIVTTDGASNEAVLVFENQESLIRESGSKHTAKTIAALAIFKDLAAAGTVTDAAWLAAMEVAEGGTSPQTLRARRDRARKSLIASGDIVAFENGYHLADKHNSQNIEM